MRELFLLTAVLGLGLTQWRDAWHRHFQPSPILDTADIPRLLRSIPLKSGRLALNGGGGGNRSPSSAQLIYEYSLAADGRDLLADGFVLALQQEVARRLQRNECEIHSRGVSRSAQIVTGFAYQYTWQQTTGIIHVRTHRCANNELKMNIVQLEFLSPNL